MPLSNRNKNPITSNDFPEYKFLSKKSKVFLNIFRGSLPASAITGATVAVGTNPQILEKTHEVVTAGLAGFAGGVAVGMSALVAYVHTSGQDEQRHQQREEPRTISEHELPIK